MNASFPGVVYSVQKLYASSSRRSDVPELLKKKHSKLQARSGIDDDDDDEDDDEDAVDTEDEMLTDTNDDEIIDLKQTNTNKRKSDDSGEGETSPTKKTKTEVFGLRSIYLLVAVWCSGNGVGHICETILCRAQLILGWVTSSAGKTTLVCNQPPRLTQPPSLSSTANEYQPKCVDLWSKVRHGSFHLWMYIWVSGKTV